MSDHTYRGWTIHQGRWPEPAWRAYGPNYDASWEGEEDGWVDNGEKADADTHAALLDEIDAWIDDQAGPKPIITLRRALALALFAAAVIVHHVGWSAGL